MVDADRVRRLPWKLRYIYGERLATATRKALIRATHQHCHVEFRGPVRLGPGFSLNIPGPGTFIVGEGVDFRRGFHCEISGHGRVIIGAGSVFTSGALVQCTTSIEIGERCHLGQALLLVDGNHRFRDPNLPLMAQGYDYRPIRIGNDVSIMAKCTVLADIGEHSFIGSNAVVSKPVPAFCLALGAPARVVEYFGPPELRPPGIAMKAPSRRSTQHEIDA
jgi:acetyltransferase-like isoleucine patch superfamily enzyme